MVGYTGSWAAHVPLIKRLHGEGFGLDEIAGLVPEAEVAWDWQPAGISAAMVRYVLEREGEVACPVEWGDNRVFVADFRRRWEKWERGGPPAADAFVVLARWLWEVSGWIAEEVEARQGGRFYAGE